MMLHNLFSSPAQGQKLRAGTQGLAPHYDDVDLWVCQTMGSKHWRVYKSPEGYTLPAVSSTDFQQAELGAPVLETILEVSHY